MKRSLQAIAVIAMAFFLNACASNKVPLLPPSPTIVNVSLQTDATINPDSKGSPNPVVVRYYLLANSGQFESADFFSIFEGDDKALAGTIVSREEVSMRPGQTLDVKLKPQQEARAIGVFVAYRNFERSVWRATAAVPQNKTSTFKVSIGRDKVSIVPAQ